MPRYSPPYYGSPRRVYSSRGRSPPRGGYSPPRRRYSPPRRGYGGSGGGRRKEQSNGSLLVRNIPLDCRSEELRVPFERFGLVRDVYIPKDYYTGEPRGFAFVQFVNPYDASEAQYYMNRQIFGGREISVVVAAESRKRPEEMRRKARIGGSRYGGRRSPYRHSRSQSFSRSPLPHHQSGSRVRCRSRSYSLSPRRHGGYSVSPGRKHVDRSRSPRDTGNGYDKKSKYEAEEARDYREPSPQRVSRSPSGSRSRSADVSPARST